MTLTYKFDPEDDYGFEKDLSQREVEEYFKSLSADEIVEALKTAFYTLTKDDQHFVLGEMQEPNFACPDFARWIEEDIDYCLDILVEAEDQFEDELHDYYEDKAYKEWRYEEAHKDPDDPYAQRGLRYSDFY